MTLALYLSTKGWRWLPGCRRDIYSIAIMWFCFQFDVIWGEDA